MDTILKPWLIDIVPQDLRSFAKKINSILKPGARWVNFGSLVFHHRLQQLCYSRDEIPQILEEAGFAILRVEEPLVPYLQSPHSCQLRQEKIFSFVARKVREVEAGPRFSSSPHWLENPDLSVAMTPDIQQQVIVNLSLAQILSQVDGQRSLRQIAELLAPQFSLPAEDLIPMLKRVFAKFLETRGRQQNF
ncbi:MAG: hypothetical protein NTX25_06515 [Proteobacteria bacterium]|nr:hypothetical protein [Pseudomonadota bacterium]